MLKIKIILLLIILLFSVIACNESSRRNTKELKINDLTNDSTKNYINYSNSIFCIPSPQLANMYLKRLGIYPDRSIVNLIINAEKYNTSTKKALNIGVYGVDLGYMNIFSVSENTNAYISGINTLSEDLGLDLIFTNDAYNHLTEIKNSQDSVAKYLSTLFKKADTYLNDNSEQRIAVLVVTGGWLESFYLLCNTYNQTKKKEIKNLIFHQKFVLDNLIKSLAPYYESSVEMQQLIDNLVEIAYEFDVLDFKFKYNEPIYTLKKGLMVFDNDVKISNAEQNFETIILKVEQLREMIIL